MISELSAHADMLGLNTAASLTFNDRDSALNLLAALRIEHHIVAACTYDRRGNIFAEYRRAGAGKDLMMPAWHEDGEQSGPDALTLYRSISLNGEKIGSIALVSDYSALAAKMKQFRETSALVLIVSILVTALVSSRLVRLITEPILQLAGIAAKVSANEDYTLRGLPEMAMKWERWCLLSIKCWSEFRNATPHFRARRRNSNFEFKRGRKSCRRK